MTKNQKKRLKKKLKKHQELLSNEESTISDMDIIVTDNHTPSSNEGETDKRGEEEDDENEMIIEQGKSKDDNEESDDTQLNMDTPTINGLESGIPLNVKIADLGNACWIVCPYMEVGHDIVFLRIITSLTIFKQDSIAL